MLLMCSDCFEIDYRKRRSGIYCKKCGGYLEEIDDNFIQAISLLNKKGYITKFCCSGHPKNDHINESYIFFEKNIILPHLPNGYKYDEDIYPQIDHTNWQKVNGIHTCIRTKFDDSNPVVLQKSILQNAINVLDWANLLPDLKNILNYQQILEIKEKWDKQWNEDIDFFDKKVLAQKYNVNINTILDVVHKK